jgi:hypothetical protein
MRYAQMPAQHLTAISAFEAHDMVALHRSPDRDCRLRRSDADTIFSNITPDDLCNQAPLDFLRAAVIGHI